MQDPVRFDEPSGLQIDEVEQLAAGNRRLLLAKLLGADAVGHTGAMRVDQRRLPGHVDRRRHCRNVEDDADLTWPGGAHLDDLAARGKAGA